MTDVEKLNAEIARLTAERDALEKPVSDAERWARVYQSALRKASDYWAEFDTFNEYRQRQCIAAMQPVIDGIRAEWAQERNDLIIRERHSNDVVDQYIEELRLTRKELVAMTVERDAMREELATLRRLYSEDSRSLSNKWAAAISERNALKTQVDALAVRAAGLESERDALAARVQRGGVEPDVTAEEFCDDWMASKGETWSAFCLRYLAEHATVVTPGDLPSAEELARVYYRAMNAHPRIAGCVEAGIRAVLAHLRPWLRPRTITHEQLDAAARVITTQRVVDENSTLADTARGIAQDVFTAVGITVEVTE